MRILVTGISGQLGSAIRERFASQGTILAADRATLDLSKPGEIAQRLNELSPDVIINPAAYTAVDRAEEEQEFAYLVNASGPEALARWAAPRRVPLVHFSTDYVFDGSGERPWREDDPTGPINIYGASKLAGERAVRAADGPHLIVRTSWIYAATGNNFLRTMVRLARKQTELRVVSDQIGSPTSAPFIADMLAHIFRDNIADLATAFSSARGLVHLTAGGQTSWHGFASAIISGLKRRNTQVMTESVIPILTKDYTAAKAARPLNSRLDLSLLQRTFELVPPAWQSLLELELEKVVRADASK